MESPFKRFIDVKDDMPSEFILGLSSGVLYEDGVISNSQRGAENTFSVGMPIFTLDGEFIGRLSVGLYDDLNYHTETGDGVGDIPVEHWRIDGYKSDERIRILSYYQWKNRFGVE